MRSCHGRRRSPAAAWGGDGVGCCCALGAAAAAAAAAAAGAEARTASEDVGPLAREGSLRLACASAAAADIATRSRPGVSARGCRRGSRPHACAWRGGGATLARARLCNGRLARLACKRTPRYGHVAGPNGPDGGTGVRTRQIPGSGGKQGRARRDAMGAPPLSTQPALHHVGACMRADKRYGKDRRGRNMHGDDEGYHVVGGRTRSVAALDPRCGGDRVYTPAWKADAAATSKDGGKCPCPFLRAGALNTNSDSPQTQAYKLPVCKISHTKATGTEPERAKHRTPSSKHECATATSVCYRRLSGPETAAGCLTEANRHDHWRRIRLVGSSQSWFTDAKLLARSKTAQTVLAGRAARQSAHRLTARPEVCPHVRVRRVQQLAAGAELETERLGVLPQLLEEVGAGRLRGAATRAVLAAL
eukprot:39813-Chlamydomonas_euryale.AAC.8